MSVVAIGDNVVDCYLDSGMLYPGGNCVNVAVAVRKAGVSSAYIGALGTDAAGDVIHQALLDEGVDVSHVRKVDGTNAYATVRHEGSDRRFGPRDVGVRRFVPDSGDLSFLESFRIAHTSYCSFLEPSLADIAGRIRVSFDFDNGHETGYADDLLRHVWMAEFSGADLSHKEVREVAKWAHARGPEYVLITRGALGALLFDGHTFVHQEAQQADIVDTLGAGDAFIGRMLAGFATGEPVPDLLAAASAAASATCGTFGGFGHGVRTPEGYPPGMSANAVEVPARPTV